jgi:cytochrome c oxidase subunit II
LNTLFRRLARPGTALGAGLWTWLLSSSVQAQQVSQSLNALNPSSSYNREMNVLVIWGLAFAVIIFVGVSGALFYTVNKFREDKNTAEPAQFHGNNRLEIALVGVPVLIVMVLALLTVRAMARLNPTPVGAYPVSAVAAQFYWNFEYPNAKVAPAVGNGLVTNGNELILPVGTQVAMTTTSRDVIHGFWAPDLGGQRAAVPSVKKVWQIDTNTPGVYQGNCTQLCGASHANMRFKVIALAQPDYDQFVSVAQSYKAPTPAAGSPEQLGYNIFMNGKEGSGACAACHRVQGTAAAGQSGPDLSFFGSRRTLGAGFWEGADVDKNLHEWLKHSPVVKPGSVMPRYDGGTPNYPVLSDAEIDGVAAYIKSLKLPDTGNYWTRVTAAVPGAPVPAPQAAQIPPTPASTQTPATQTNATLPGGN